MEKKVAVDDVYSVKDEASETGTSTPVIYVDSELERAAFKKFDKCVVPASFVFMLLCALDRNNVSDTHLSSEEFC
jgi:hypothetical protein